VVGVAAAKLLPYLSQAARPVTRGLMAGAIDLSYKTKTLVAEAREEFDTMVAEAEYRRSLQTGAGAGAAQPEPEPLPMPERSPDQSV
jgi:hypothetical protein